MSGVEHGSDQAREMYTEWERRRRILQRERARIWTDLGPAALVEHGDPIGLVVTGTDAGPWERLARLGRVVGIDVVIRDEVRS